MLTSIEEEEQLLEGLPGQPPRKEEEERNNNAANKKKEQYQNSCLHVFCSTLATVCLFLVIFTMDDESKRNNGLDLNDIGSRFHDLAVSNDTVAVAPRPTFRGQSADIMADIMEKTNSSSDSETDATDMGKPDKLPLRLAEVEAPRPTHRQRCHQRVYNCVARHRDSPITASSPSSAAVILGRAK